MTGFVNLHVEFSHLTKGGTRYKVLSDDGDVILSSSRDPWHESARSLLADGAVEPDDFLMIHRGGMFVASGRVGYLAAHMVSEGASTSPRIVPYREHFMSAGDDGDNDGEN